MVIENGDKNEKDEEEEDEEQSIDAIFRARNLERLSNPTQLDTMLNVVVPKDWVFLFSIIAIFIGFILWSIFGSIPVRIEGRGIVISSFGLFNVQNKVTGIVKKFLVQSGDIVQKGALLAQLTDSEKELELSGQEIHLQNLERDLVSLKEEITREFNATKIALNREIASKEFAVEQLQLDVKNTEERNKRKRELVEQGLISQTELDKAEQLLIAKRIELETTLSSISTLKARLVQGYRTEEYRNKEQEVFRVNEQITILKNSIENMNVYSYYPGKVLQWLVNVGDMVMAGTPLIWMEHIEEGKEQSYSVLGYVPIEQGKKIKVGDGVQIELKNVNTQEYGYMMGRVESVSLFAESQKNIVRKLQNEGLAIYLTENNPVVTQLEISLIKDPSTPSGYKWTSGKGPSIHITTGSVATIRATVEYIRPIYYVFPIWELKYVFHKSDVNGTGTEAGK